jgi:hypothetical protein
MIDAVEIIAAGIERNQDVSLTGHGVTIVAALVFIGRLINKYARMKNIIFSYSFK